MPIEKTPEIAITLNKIELIKIIRQMLGLGLKESKALADGMWPVLLSNEPIGDLIGAIVLIGKLLKIVDGDFYKLYALGQTELFWHPSTHKATLVKQAICGLYMYRIGE